MWLVETLNPDGLARGTRANARGVDLNRNFPYRWRPLGPAGSAEYAGPRPLSEPESRAAARLIVRARPRVTIWFHQPLDVVDLSGGSTRIERTYARKAHMRVRRLLRYPGSVAGWQNHRLPPTTSFVVELPARRLSPRQVRRLADAALAVAGIVR